MSMKNLDFRLIYWKNHSVEINREHPELLVPVNQYGILDSYPMLIENMKRLISIKLPLSLYHNV